MRAMVLKRISSFQENRNPLELVDLPKPEPKEKEILIKVSVCGVCHTEIDEIEGRTPPARFPMVLGHQVVGNVEESGTGASKFKSGERVGVGWIFSACGHCKFCRSGNENLCDEFMATGRDVNGGYAEYMTVPEQYAYKIPDFFQDEEAAPLLCAGAIGFRCIRLAGLKDGQKFGLTGFGASGHLMLKMVNYRYPQAGTYVFARKKDEQSFAMELGARWAGDTAEKSPDKLDSIVDTTPAWKPVVEALGNLEKGGRLVINAIRKTDKDKDYLQQLSYQEHLWLEKEIKSVANVTGKDIRECLTLAAEASITPNIQEYPLEEANKALQELTDQKIRGAKVLRIS